MRGLLPAITAQELINGWAMHSFVFSLSSLFVTEINSCIRTNKNKKVYKMIYLKKIDILKLKEEERCHYFISRVDRWTYDRLDILMNGRMGRRLNRWIRGCLNGWMGGWMVGWMHTMFREYHNIVIKFNRRMDERCFRPLFCTIKAELGRGQPGLMRWSWDETLPQCSIDRSTFYTAAHHATSDLPAAPKI